MPPRFDFHRNEPYSLPHPDDVAAIRTDLDRLNAASPGLGERALACVLGDGDASDLEGVCDLIRRFENALWGWPLRSEDGWIPGRSDYISRQSRWQPEVLRRYGRLLTVRAQSNGQQYEWVALPGSSVMPLWLRVVLFEYGRARQARPTTAVTFDIGKLNDLLHLDGLSANAVMDLAFEQPPRGLADRVLRWSVTQLDGFASHLQSDAAARVGEIRKLTPAGLAAALRYIARRRLCDGPFLDLMYQAWTHPNQLVRRASAIGLRTVSPIVVLDCIERDWDLAAQSQRIALAQLAATVGGPEATAFLAMRAETEPAAVVRTELERLTAHRHFAVEPQAHADEPGGYLSIRGDIVLCAPEAELPPEPELSAECRELLARLIEAHRQMHQRRRESRRARKFFMPFPDDAESAFLRATEPWHPPLRHDTSEAHMLRSLDADEEPDEVRRALARQVTTHPSFSLMRLLRWSVHRYGAGAVTDATEAWQSPIGAGLWAKLAHRDFRTLVTACERFGYSRESHIRRALNTEHSWLGWCRQFGRFLWPYFAEHLQHLDEALATAAQTGSPTDAENRALELLTAFPATPARFFKPLLHRATGEAGNARDLARQLLDGAQGLTAPLCGLLKHSRAPMRAGVAEWLGRLADPAAIEPLREAVRHERDQAARGGMLVALRRLGANLGEFLSPARLLAEATTDRPKLSIHPHRLEGLKPAVDLVFRDGSLVPHAVIEHWLRLALHADSAGGDRLFDLYLDQLEPESASELGVHLLETFVARDVGGAARSEVIATKATRMMYLAAHDPRRTALPLRGALALAVRAAGPVAASIVNGYFRAAYARTAQCRALLECMAANCSFEAIQFVRQIARHWPEPPRREPRKLASIRQRAGQLLERMGERHGWQTSEDVEHVLPSCGFTRDGRLKLPMPAAYRKGEGTWCVRLDADLTLRLFNAAGETEPELPKGETSGETRILRAARSVLFHARKDVRDAGATRTRQLYEAMCAQRAWTAERWREVIAWHPIARILAQRLVWRGACNAAEDSVWFRAGEDGLPIQIDGNRLDLREASTIRLAHRTTMPLEVATAWRKHLRTLKIRPLFDQLGRKHRDIAAGDEEMTEIDDRRGWMLNGRTLRKAALRLGYEPGDMREDGTFHAYVKRLPSLGLTTAIRFTGNRLPEENLFSALLGVRFLSGDDSGDPVQVFLSEVPKVLLSEAWNDLHAIAEAGVGYVADWEQQSAW